MQRCLKVVDISKPKEFGFRACALNHSIILTFGAMKCFYALNIPWVFIKSSSSYGKGSQDSYQSTEVL